MMEARVDRFGRVVIPKELRTALDIRPGTVVELATTDGRLILRPRTDESHVADRDGVLVYTGTSEGDLAQAVQDFREGHIASAVERSWK